MTSSLRIALLCLVCCLCSLLFATEPVGKWTFDNAANLLAAEVGTDLTLTGSHVAVSGPTAGNGAARIGPGSFYRCYHGIPANGGGTWVNEYSLLIDFKVPSLGQWYCFFQTSYQNSNDGDAFVNTSGQVGVAQTGYSSYTLIPNEWYRLVISADLGSSYKYYLDGQLLQDGGVQAVDGRFSLYPLGNYNQVLFCADDNGEDNLIDVAEVRLYDVPLSAGEVGSLGGYGHNLGSGPAAMLPFLQSPTTTSIYISWHNSQSPESVVDYGYSTELGQTASGTTHSFNATTLWHTVKLENLAPGTKYYYRCRTGTDQSALYSFKTLPLSPVYAQHYRFLIVGDSQSNVATSTYIVSKITEKCAELFGANWRDALDLVCHVGDIVGYGGSLGSYASEFFVPFAPLSGYVPVMVSIGNHEVESSNYYNYMQYEDFGGPEGEKYYSFDAAGLRFIFLNPHISTTQEQFWLTQKLAEADANPAIRHIFSFCHTPGHSEVWPDGNNAWTQNSVIPALENSPKAAILAGGHSHNYEHGTSCETRLRRLICGGAGGTLDRWGMYANQTNYPEVHKSLDQYHWVLVDVNLANYSYTAKVFSLGNSDRPRNNELVDSWGYVPNSDAPPQPQILGVTPLSGNRVQLTLTPYGDWFNPFFSHGGEISATTDFSAPLASGFRAGEDVYGDSGSPLWEPVNLNSGMDKRRVVLNAPILTPGNSYWVRGWYRNTNLDKTPSEPFNFTHHTYAPSCDFVADRQTVFQFEGVQFTDLSAADQIVNWYWDFQNDGIIDSNERDPMFQYYEIGTYTVSLSVGTGDGLLTEVKQGYIEVIWGAADDPELPGAPLQVLGCHPNPCSRSNTLRVALKDPGPLRVELFNQRGQLVRVLFAGDKASGEHQFVFDGLGERGEALPRGIYFYKLRAGNTMLTRKLALLK